MASSNNLSYRYEKKYMLKGISYETVSSIIASHPAFFKKQYNSRNINNIYFDTFDRQFVNENLDGLSVRIKPRMRWYGQKFGEVVSPKLELKHKKNALGTKSVYSLEKGNFILEHHFNPNDLVQFILSQDIPDTVRSFLKFLTPVLLNNYLRDYYVSADNKFRITVDHAINYNSLEFLRSNLVDSAVAPLNNVIIEVKYDKINCDIADNITSFIPFAITKSSKYVTGSFLTNYWLP